MDLKRGPRRIFPKLFFALYLILSHSNAEKQSVSDSGIWFTKEPSDVTVVPGSGALLDCEARSVLSEPPIISWRTTTDGQSINPIVDSRRTQLENGSLWIRNVRGYDDEEGGEEEYQCMARIEEIGTIVSRKGKVKTARLSPILDPPQDLTLFPGQTAYFACYVQGRPTPTVTWIKDQKPLIFEESRMTLLPSGALEIDDVKFSDAGNYRCNVSGLGRHRISNKAMLTIDHDLEAVQNQMTPVFVGTPRETVALEGSSVTLDCSANGYPEPDISWFKDGSNLDPVMKLLGSRFIRVGTGSLQISKIEEGDAGNYQCRAENGVDSIESHAPLIVQVAPRFVKVPKSSTGDDKKDIEFECKVTGKPEPKVMWLKNGDIITPNEYMKILNGNNLRILGLLEQDKGIFQCVASNPAGNIQAAALLTVTIADVRSVNYNHGHGRGRGGGSGGDSSNTVGPPVDLELVMLKPRFVTLKWKAPASTGTSPVEIKSYNVFYQEESYNRERVVNTHIEEAIISSLLPNTTYSLRVAAVTSNGLGKSTAPLVVITKPELHVPGPPRIISVIPTTTEINVIWNPPTLTNGNIHKYKLFYFESETAEEHRVETSDTNYTVSRLKKFTEYIVWVVAYNHNGAGANSEEVTVTTLSDVPSEPPTNITVEPASSTSVIVRWEPPPPEGRNGVITGYKLKYRMKGGRGRAETMTTGGDMRMYAITGLERSSNYQVRIWAMTVNGTGPPTDWYNIETYENDLDESTVPDAPNGMRVKASADSITVMWTPPKNPNIMVRDYTIGWGKGIPDEYSGKLDGKQRSYVIKHLEANSEYVISLRAENSKGSGAPIYENVRTRDEPPPEPITPLSPPVGLKATVLSPNTVVLFWTDTTLPFSQVVTDNRYYQVRYGQYHGHHGMLTSRYKYYNTTDLNYMIDDLKPFTQYEFTVKMIKGKRESAWSMVVVNTTMETVPSSAPRDVTVLNVDDSPGVVTVSWQPPKQPNGLITGYLISYTTDLSTKEKDWLTETVQGDKMTATIRSLNIASVYYFNVQARNSKGFSPASPTVSVTTLSGFGGAGGGGSGGSSGVSNLTLFYAVGISCAVLVIIVVAIIAAVLCCRSKTEQMSPSRSKKGYTKGKGSTSNIKPPDLWIHHDQMELKNLEKSQDQMSTSTLPREHTSTLEKQQQRDNYNPSSNYMGGSQCQPLLAEEKTSTARRNIKHKPITLPVDNSPFIRESVSVGGSLTPQSSTSEARPLYPRTQYSISSRAHVTIDPNLTENPYVMHPSTSVSYEPLGTQQTPAQTQQQPSQSNYSVGVVGGGGGGGGGASGSGSGDNNKRLQGHPLKSFSVPAPPPQSAPTTPQQKHIVTVRPQASSPYKKSGGAGGQQYSTAPAAATTSSSILSTSPLPTKSKQHTADDLPKIQPSYSTEELNQEMANLEGLMKDLNAITASEFQC